jgi:catechol 2,3-dioxygenase-like lactoylglutathione lyase family enzyme
MSIQDDIQNHAEAAASPIKNHHIAVRVSNLERAGQFFIDALGANWLTEPLPIDKSACHYLFAGPPNGTARFAFVGFNSPDQPAFELIEFVEPRIPVGPSNTWEDNFMHCCFTAPDVEGTLARIEAAGGQRFREIKKFPDPAPELSQVYFRDPDGNLFQLLSEPLGAVVDRLRLQYAEKTE